MRNVNGKRDWIIRARKAKNLTASEVAEAVGISRSHYSMIENNHTNPSLKVGLQIATYLNIDVDNFSKERMLRKAENKP